MARPGQGPHRHPAHAPPRRDAGLERLLLGDDDLVLGPGEVAEFDTTVPHWFGSTGEEPTELLSIFGRPGERMVVRKRAGRALP